MKCTKTRHQILATTILALLLATAAQGQDAGVRIDRDVEAPMRDGVVLRADVYRPDGDGPWPVLLERTPYGKQGLHPLRHLLGWAHPQG